MVNEMVRPNSVIVSHVNELATVDGKVRGEQQDRGVPEVGQDAGARVAQRQDHGIRRQRALRVGMLNEICFTPARQLARLLRTRKLSRVEVMKAFIAQIERVNPKVNAIVTFLPEQALDGASEGRSQGRARRRRRRPRGPADRLQGHDRDQGHPHHVRLADLSRTTFPTRTHVIVERLKAAGAITLGKTNTPEFAAGSQTFNQVFGATLNPYDLDKTCGGSSGGAAVAVACGMLPFADGSDLGGSLRNPANFCNVVGFRPTPGRMPYYPADNVWDTLSRARPDRALGGRRRVPALGDGGARPALADQHHRARRASSRGRSSATSARCGSAWSTRPRAACRWTSA